MESIALIALLVATAIFFILLIFGLPLSFAMGSAALFGYLIVYGPKSLASLVYNTWEYMNAYLLIAGLMFYLMADVLQRTGMADGLFEMAYRWLAGLRGGLAMTVVVWCAIFAAMSGVGAAAIITMSLLALPSMFKRGYSKDIALGSIAAGAPLGILIPPSVVMIFYCLFTGLSIGKLFMAGVFPGILLTILFCGYIGIRCWLKPSMGPAIPPEERFTWKQKFSATGGVVLPVIIVFLVLGTIYLGIATPTEASAIGATGSIIAALVYRRLTWKKLWDSLMSATKLNSIVLWLTFGGATLGTLITSSGLPAAVNAFALGLEVNRWFILIGMQVIVFIAGMFFEPFVIILLFIPTFHTMVVSLGFDPLWFGLLITINIVIGYLTPPFGFSLYVMKTVVPKGILLRDIIHSVWPFIALQVIGLAIIMIFPQIAVWLPNIMIGK